MYLYLALPLQAQALVAFTYLVTSGPYCAQPHTFKPGTQIAAIVESRSVCIHHHAHASGTEDEYWQQGCNMWQEKLATCANV